MSIITLDIHVDDPAEVVVLYNTIQIWRSPDESGSPTPYREIAAFERTSATVIGTVVGPWNLTGLPLIISFDGGPEKTILFTGSNPKNITDVIAAINAVIPGVASELGNTNKLKITSPITGTESSILITANAAASVLGLASIKENGKGSYPLLSASTEEYKFVDFDGFDYFWYKTRFYNTETEAFSDFSEPRKGGVEDVIPPSNLMKCFLYLADGRGKPIIDRRIMIVPISSVQVTNDNLHVYTVLPSVDNIYMVTDELGYAEIMLIKGQTVKIFIEGTTFQREVSIPTSGSSLNLLTAAIAAPDPFTIIESPPIPIRNS